jgi:crotonobetainyl-CoA:carnitine CoA-transferase CaiB-like acyl-CoA transferase
VAPWIDSTQIHSIWEEAEGVRAVELPYRMVDCTDGEFLLCGKILADLGSQVILVEPPDGHPARRRPPLMSPGEGHSAMESIQWWSYNTGKESLIVDMGAPSGSVVLESLIKSSDAIVLSEKPPIPIGPELEVELHRWNPSLVITKLSSFGQFGPYREFAGSELVTQALSGYLRLNGDPDRAPVRIGHSLAFLLAAAYGALYTVVALRSARQRAVVDVSTQAAAGWQLLNAGATPVLEHMDPERAGIYSAAMAQIQGIPFPLIYPCRDGHILFFVIGGPGGARSFYELREWMKEHGMAPAILDEMVWEEIDFRNDPKAKPMHDAVVEAWMKFFPTKTKHEIMERSLERGILISPINDMADVAKHTQLLDRGFYHELSDGPGTMPGGFIIADGKRIQKTTPPPRLAERLISPDQLQPRPTRNEATSTPARLSVGTGREPYSGLRILDLGWLYAGPVVPRFFGELGANVIRIESVSRVDLTRTSGPFKDAKPGWNRAQLFAEANANKRSLGINMGSKKGLAIARRIACEWADVIAEGFTPGTLEKWQLTYEDLNSIRPDLIVARTCQMGQTGPWRNYRGFGWNAASIAGLLSITGWPDRGPTLFHGAYTDVLNPPLFAIALAAMIERRERTGQGGTVDVAQLEVTAYYVRELLLEYFASGRVASRTGNRDGRFAPQGVYPCRGDDNWTAITCRETEQWLALCEVAGLDDLAKDESLMEVSNRHRRHDEIDQRLSQWTVGWDPDDLMWELQAKGVPAGAVLRLSEWIEDPQLNARGQFRWLSHPVMDYVPYLGPPALSNTFANTVKRAPLLGEHSGEVLKETLGMNDEEIADLVAEGILEFVLD